MTQFPQKTKVFSWYYQSHHCLLRPSSCFKIALELLCRRAFTLSTYSIDSAIWLKGFFLASHAKNKYNYAIKASILVYFYIFDAICLICFIGITIVLISTLKYYKHLNFCCFLSYFYQRSLF